MRRVAGPVCAGLLALVVAGAASPAATTEVPHFVYTFYVSSLAVDGTAKPVNDGATVTIHLHLARPSRIKGLRWEGKHGTDPNNGDSGAGVPLAGKMVFEDASEPTCSRTVQISPARAKEVMSMLLLNARDPVVTHAHLGVGVSGYPVEIDNRGGGTNPPKCGFPFRSDSGVSKNYPLSVLHKKGFTLRVHRLERIPGVGSIDWNVVMTVRRMKYIPLP